MQQRALGPFNIFPVGLGCMNLSHAYLPLPTEKAATTLLQQALEAGIDFFDTAALYGFGANETLIGKALKGQRQRFVLASKCGMTGVNGKRIIDGRPATLKATCEAALQRLQTDVIDLYYLHRLDFNVPIEESIGALADLVREGKIRAIGLSEVSASTLHRAHAVHPIAAVQSEYSLWSREVEIAVLDACQQLGTTFVAFSPLARGFLSGDLTDPTAQLLAGDLRLGMPRFTTEYFPHNRHLLHEYRKIATELNHTPAQLALAWILNRHPQMVVIPGTCNLSHLQDNIAAAQLTLDTATLDRLDQLINEKTVAGPRYNDSTQQEIDTEQFV